MFVRKFFDVDMPETVSGTTTTETPSLASLMAKSGVVNDSETMVATPIANTTELNEKPVTTEATPAEPATEQVTTQETQVTPAEQTAPVFGEKPQIEAPKAEPVAWQEVLKVQQPEAVLKELGFDEKMVAFLNHWKNNGDVQSYLRELSTDYSTMPSEEVMKHQLRREYPKASEKAIDILYQEEVIDRYKLDPDTYTEAEIERGKMLLDAKAEKYREELVNNQKNFLLSPPPEKSNEPDPKVLEMQAEQKRHSELYINTMRNDELTRQILTDKKITIGEGFSYPVDTEALTNILLDGEAYRNAVFDKQKDATGREVYVPNVRKQWLVAAVAKYGDEFLKDYANHYKALGAKKTIEPIENASVPAQTNLAKSAIPPKTVAEAMAKTGYVVG